MTEEGSPAPQPYWGSDAYLLGRWTNRVRYSDSGGGYAFRPGHFIAEAPPGWELALDELTQHSDFQIDESHFTPLGGNRWLVHHPEGHEDDIPMWLCRLLEFFGFTCEPDYVVFSDGIGPSVSPSRV